MVLISLNNLPPPVTHSFFLTPTTPDEVKTELNNLSESIASDIPVKILKMSSQHLGNMLSHIYNDSFGTGEYPTKLKISIVTPIHKADSKLLVTNYRPISLLPVFSKVFERLVHRRLLNFLMQNNTLINHHFGFQPSKTTNMAILDIYTKIVNALENKDIACSVYLDFAKAVDTVNHNILISKLENYGIRGIALNWFKSYLADRTQVVKINFFLIQITPYKALKATVV